MPNWWYSACISFAVGCLLLTISIADRLLAQGETTSAIAGTVSDPSGGAVAGAGVTIVNDDTGGKGSATTDDAGGFRFPQLKPGPYTARVEAQGFEPQMSGPVFSGLGQKQSLSFILKLAAAKDEI